MRPIQPTDEQADVIVQAMHAVISAEGSLDLLPIEEQSLAAIRRHMLHRAEPLEVGARTLPTDLAEVVADPGMRLEVLRILVMLPFIDQKVLPAKAAVVDRAAALLGVHDAGLTMLRQAVRRQYRRITVGILGRAIRGFWSNSGKARLRDWVDMGLIILPFLTPARRALREKYQNLEHARPGTLGQALYTFYRANGFPMPGEPKGFPEKFVLHEIYHILSAYPANHTGEMLTGAFTGGNVDKLCMDMILLSLLQYQVGASVAPSAPGMPGRLKPDDFFHAIARGSAMTVNLMDDWTYWDDIDVPVDELRRRFGIPELRGTESFKPLRVALSA